KSVNGKSLDIRLRLPPGFERLELALKKRLAATCQRGNVQGVLGLERTGVAPPFTVNEALFSAAAATLTELARRNGLAPPSVDALLALRGIIDPKSEDALIGENNPMETAIGETLAEAAAALKAARQSEGAALAAVITGHLDRIASLIDKTAADASRRRDHVKARLRRLVAELMEAGAALDEQRLNAEAAIIAAKADIQEELDRLAAHVAAARALLAEGGTIGRRLDFLAQEFNREANTICSKAGSAAITEYGLELKTVIDQMREQIQNIE
nr:YicC family protein [Rhizobiaceae bacterium]